MSEKGSKENKLGTMPVGPLLISMAVPMMLSFFIQALYNIVDSMFVARISEEALASVSLAFPMQQIMNAIGIGTGVGISASIPRLIGQKKKDEADSIANTGIFLCLCYAAVFIFLGFTFAHRFYLMQTDVEEIIRSGTMPIVRLENVFRQAQLSPIVRNAHRINQGLMPEWKGEKDFVFTPFASEEETMRYIVDLYEKLVRTQSWENVQVLTPMHKNVCGVENLNRLLQGRVNPPAPDKPELTLGLLSFREGDKVMQIRNNYEKNVFNGDLGTIERIQGKYVLVSFPDRPEDPHVGYDGAEVEDLRLAYAMSVHKAQGSEYAVVIMPLVPSHYILLQRNLFYTAVTRARKQVYLAGSLKAMQMAVGNDRTQKRYSLLAERLKQAFFE